MFADGGFCGIRQAKFHHTATFFIRPIIQAGQREKTIQGNALDFFAVEQGGARLAEQFREEQDQAEYERSRREQAEYIERLHNYELKKQLGEPINPEEFAPGEKEPLPPAPWEDEDDDEENADDKNSDDPDAGDVAVKKKPDPPPMWYDDYEHPLADEYRLAAYLTLDEIWFYAHHRDLAIYLMRRQPDLEIPEEKKPE